MSTTSETNVPSGLWNEGYGAVGATLKALEDAGATLDHLKLIRSNEAVAKAIAELLQNASKNRYANEEVQTSYVYPDAYKVKPLAEQIATLAKLFNLDGSKALANAEHLPELPEGAEGWFAIPRFQHLGTYEQAVERMLALIGDKRHFKNWLQGKVGARYLRQSEQTKEMMQTLIEKQQSDILIVPAQFGFRHRGKSEHRARETFYENEFGLGAFAVGCMLLTHPEREEEWEQLHIDCSGDEYSPGADGQFVNAPFFNWGDGRLRFGSSWTSNAGKRYGSASGFLPQE